VRRPRTELGRLDRDLRLLRRELVESHRQLENLRAAGAVSAEHAARQTRLGQILRAHIDYLEPAVAEAEARVAAEELSYA
jgi:hypothetical protein